MSILFITHGEVTDYTLRVMSIVCLGNDGRYAVSIDECKWGGSFKVYNSFDVGYRYLDRQLLRYIGKHPGSCFEETQYRFSCADSARPLH